MIKKLKKIKITAQQFDELLNSCQLIRNNKYDQPKVGLFKEKKLLIFFGWIKRNFLDVIFILYHNNLYVMPKKFSTEDLSPAYQRCGIGVMKDK